MVEVLGGVMVSLFDVRWFLLHVKMHDTIIVYGEWYNYSLFSVRGDMWGHHPGSKIVFMFHSLTRSIPPYI
jgi:hypothetical protein